MLPGIEKVTFTEYRCFDKLPLDFKKKVNLLFGDNSSGKSTIIRGLSTVLNSFFIGYSDENTRFFGLEKEDFRHSQSSTGLTNEAPIDIEFTFLGKCSKLELHSKKGRTLQRPLNEIYYYGKELYQSLFEATRQVKELPLLASFSTSDIHAIRKISSKYFLRYEHKPSFGYYECLQGDGFLSYWTKRMLVLREASKGQLEIEGVRNAIINALGESGCAIISDVQIRHNQGKIYYILTDGREIETDALSDGYRRLVNIVTDLAFRCMILNQGIFGEDACKRTSGTVLIDEIDLHLHPSLQALVLKGLCTAFPNVQWIVTTHAPMIMTQVENDDANLIYQLRFDPTKASKKYSATPATLYGLDASSIITSYLHTTPRSENVDHKLKNLFDYIDKEEYEDAAKTLTKLKTELGATMPDLVKAETMLNLFSTK
jgi:predicted ATP-binding protein involved in virulence